MKGPGRCGIGREEFTSVVEEVEKKGKPFWYRTFNGVTVSDVQMFAIVSNT